MTAYMHARLENLCPTIHEELANGNTIKGACGVAGMPRSTFYYWQEKSKRKDAPACLTKFYSTIDDTSQNGTSGFREKSLMYAKIDKMLDEILITLNETLEICRSIGGR